MRLHRPTAPLLAAALALATAAPVHAQPADPADTNPPAAVAEFRQGERDFANRAIAGDGSAAGAAYTGTARRT